MGMIRDAIMKHCGLEPRIGRDRGDKTLHLERIISVKTQQSSAMYIQFWEGCFQAPWLIAFASLVNVGSEYFIVLRKANGFILTLIALHLNNAHSMIQRRMRSWNAKLRPVFWCWISWFSICDKWWKAQHPSILDWTGVWGGLHERSLAYIEQLKTSACMFV
jgi:hypothetical protein